MIGDESRVVQRVGRGEPVLRPLNVREHVVKLDLGVRERLVHRGVGEDQVVDVVRRVDQRVVVVHLVVDKVDVEVARDALHLEPPLDLAALDALPPLLPQPQRVRRRLPLRPPAAVIPRRRCRLLRTARGQLCRLLLGVRG